MTDIPHDHLSPDQGALEEVLRKVRSCLTYDSLYCLDPVFNKVGLTIRQSSKNRMVLCKIVDGRPYCQNVIDDYIFIGRSDDSNKEISDRAIQCIIDFVTSAASSPASLSHPRREWQDGTRLYGKVTIVNEDISHVAQNIIDD